MTTFSISRRKLGPTASVGKNPLDSTGIKRLAYEHVQIMDGERQVRIRFSFLVCQRRFFVSFRCALETLAQRALFVRISQLTQKSAHFFRTFLCRLNDSRSR